MLSPTEKVLLQELLEISTLPESTLTYNELMGFMFGLAITPIYIDRDEWLDAVFGEEPCKRCGEQGYRPISDSLTQIYSVFLARQEQGQLHFPYPIEILKEVHIDEIRDWVSGLEEAFSLRPDIWDPEAEGNFANFSDAELEELFFCMMVIQGLADPVEVKFFLERIPDEVFNELFSAYDLESGEKDRNFQALMLGALPLAIQALQNFSQKMRAVIPEHVQPTSISVLQHHSLANAANQPGTLPVPRKDHKKSNIIQVDFNNKVISAKQPAALRPKSEPAPFYQLKISIKDAKPPIWRRVVVPGAITLAQLHQVIQVSMGWFNAHLHQFTIDNIDYGPVDYPIGDEDQYDENAFTLHRAARNVQKSFQYIYDFGDYWQHQILIEKRFTDSGTADNDASIKVIKGRRACPPENIGGIWGYQEFLEAYTDASHDDHATMVEWAGPDFRPESFDKNEIDEVNRILSSIRIS
ncbi:UPF0149 family protein [Desulfosediminicola ganghwensis]|uniref:UPF0149 family protein n=1 Tax=Desulfosediminicola ganghwensis TaxID=2569540 RepID=UPI0010AC2704|nr:UPF0149 family protein [Desulfosediminicola ganghwensis]